MTARSTRNTVDLILDAAMSLFIEQGVERSSMDDIAESAGVAKGTLYYYFKSKEGIVEAMVERFAQQMVQALSAGIAPSPAPLAQQLTSFVHIMTELNTQSFARLHRLKGIDIHERLSRVVINRFAPLFGQLLAAGNESGQCQVDYPLECAEFLLAATLPLFDLEYGRAVFQRRFQGLVAISSSLLKLPPQISAAIFQPLQASLLIQP